jgi:bacillithiol biosynthesis deacetylase BshB1
MSTVDVLAFGPHPDDVELFCGGLLIRMADLGYRTAVVDLTRGEMASRGTVEERRREAEDAAHILGLALRENLGLPDAWLQPWTGHDGERSQSHVARVAETIRRLRPELVVAPWEEDRHPDHEVASALVTRALFLAGLQKFETSPSHPAFSVPHVMHYPMRQLHKPSIIVDISAAADRKLAAIRAHASQVGPRPGEPHTLVASPLSLTSLEARDAFYGAQIGVAHGEPFIVREALGLADPLDHFRRNAFARPLFRPELS